MTREKKVSESRIEMAQVRMKRGGLSKEGSGLNGAKS